MSTYYYWGCDTCKKKCGKIAVVSRQKTHFDNPNETIEFVMKHRNCGLVLFSEYDDERYEYVKEPS